jgi:hypothetical protein
MDNEIQRPEKKNRYRKIEVRIWGDDKFRALSPLAPSGQALWLYLLTGPHTGPIPGIFRSGRAAMAEELDWTLEDFDKAFQEAFRQGIVKADWKSKVVWIPNAIRCNRPESPNVVTSWGSEWDLIPQCDLKMEAFECIKSYILGMGEAFVKAFDKSLTMPIGNALPKTCLNQEQEQEQEQEQKVNTTVIFGKHDQVKSIFDYWKKVMHSPKSKLDGKRRTRIAKALESYSAYEIGKAIRGCSKTPHNMGQNANGVKYNDIELILRDASHIDRFIASDSLARIGPETETQRSARVIAEFLGENSDSEQTTIDMEE